VKELPDDLAVMDGCDLAEQREVRDERLGSLFRRWPALSRSELRDLALIYAERVRIARYLGGVRARRRP
jgi:hypothetical protein